jgi:hypothetical protein
LGFFYGVNCHIQVLFIKCNIIILRYDFMAGV